MNDSFDSLEAFFTRQSLRVALALDSDAFFYDPDAMEFADPFIPEPDGDYGPRSKPRDMSGFAVEVRK